MSTSSLELSREDVRRAMAAFHTRQGNLVQAFDRLRSVQYDPLQPVGCNHDLVLQARVKGYKAGDWQKAAYRKRLIYDGWDKQASLISFAGWPLRRIFHRWHASDFERIFEGHPEAIDIVLEELARRGPMAPRDFEFQEHKPEWRSSWLGPSLTKQTLRALWHTGRVMTHSRRGNNHVYDLTERVVPRELFEQPPLSEADAIRGLLLDRHKAVGIIRPNAQYEVWSIPVLRVAAPRMEAIRQLIDQGELVPVEVDGVLAHATPEFLATFDEPTKRRRVTFIAPLDQLLWDRKMLNYVFDFDYVWEVYKPEPLRRWGYYVLPVLFGDRFVARMEAWSRKGVLEIRVWHWEPKQPKRDFWPAFELALRRFMDYCGAAEVALAPGVDPRIGEVVADRLAHRDRLPASEEPGLPVDEMEVDPDE